MDEEARSKCAGAVLGAGKGGEGDRRQPPSPGMPEGAHPSQELVSVDVSDGALTGPVTTGLTAGEGTSRLERGQ